MDAQEEQKQELEILESIYPDELTILNGEYPNIEFETTLKLELEHDTVLSKEHYIVVNFKLPEEYPEVAPLIALHPREVALREDDEDDEDEETEFDEHGNIIIKNVANLADSISFSKYMPELETLLEEQIENDMLLGMQMCFTLLSSIKDSCENWFQDQLVQLEKRHELQRQKQEMEEQAKFIGTKVTKDSYLEWRARFRKEMKLDERDSKRRELAHGGRLSGRQMFEQGVDGTEDEVDNITESLEKSGL